MIDLNSWKVINNVLYYKSLSVKLTAQGYTVTNTAGVIVYVAKSLEMACLASTKNENKWCKILDFKYESNEGEVK